MATARSTPTTTPRQACAKRRNDGVDIAWSLWRQRQAVHVDRAQGIPESALLDPRLDRRRRVAEEGRREIGEYTYPSPYFGPPAGGREYRLQILIAKTVFTGGAIGRRELKRLADQIIAVRFQHDHLVGALRHGADDVGRRLLDVVQDANQECGVVVRQRAVIERHQVDGAEARVISRLGIGAVDGCVRFIDAVDLAVAAGKPLIGKSAIAATEIEYVAVGGDAQFLSN